MGEGRIGEGRGHEDEVLGLTQSSLSHRSQGVCRWQAQHEEMEALRGHSGLRLPATLRINAFPNS